jgi:hypothetical protein
MSRIVQCGLLAAALLCSAAMAQTVNATLSGRVTDPSGGAIPKVQVSIVNEESGTAVSAETNDAGIFRVTGLTPGRYRVETSAAGFQKLVRRGLAVQVAEVLTVDLTLSVGAMEQRVEVAEAAPLIEQDTSSVDHVVDQSMIDGLPVINRAATALVEILPTATVIDVGSGGENIPIFSVAGGRVRNQVFSLDGGNATNAVGLAVPQQQLSLPVDAMREFRVITNNYSAEYGNSTSGAINMSTKSGTNQFHGSLSEFLRNNTIAARDFFAASKPRLRQHQYGASLGGPIRKDKTHFFASWEDTRQTTGAPVFNTLPTEKQRRGDFTGTLDASGRQLAMYDPYAVVNNQRQPFAGNLIPTSRFDPVAAATVSYWALPNQPGTITGANNFLENSKPTFVRHIAIGRIDHQFRPADQLAVRYYINDNVSDNQGIAGHPESDPSATLSAVRTQNLLASQTHMVRSNLVNEFRYSFLHRVFASNRHGLNQDYARKLGLRGVSDVAFPNFSVSGYTALGGSQNFRFSNPIDDHQFQEALSWFHGKHALKLGGEFRRGFFLDDIDTSSSGQFSFSAAATNQTGVAASGSAFASFLLGEVASAGLVRADGVGSRAGYAAAYVHDEWRAHPRLTLNLGMRWEGQLPRTVDGDRMNSFDTHAINPVSGTAGVVTFVGRNGVPREAYGLDSNNFGPRVGFAWRARRSGRTAVRGGVGLFYGSAISNIVSTAATLGFSTNVSVQGTQPGIASSMRLRDGFPSYTRTDQLGPGYGAVPVGSNATTNVTYFEHLRPTPISLQYNLTIDHEISRNLGLQAAYLANLSHHLTANDLTINQVAPDKLGAGNAQIKRPFPQFANVQVLNPPVGNSTYHAFYFKVQKRYSSGLLLMSHYTFSKFIDDAASYSEYGDPGSYMDAYNRRLDKGLSGSDIPHRVVVAMVYTTPVIKRNRVLSAIASRWQTGLNSNFQSGAPYTVYTSLNQTNAFSAGTQRPNRLRDANLPAAQRTLSRWFDLDAFVNPALYAFGNSPRSVLRGPARQNVNLSLSKLFALGERKRVELRGEFFNLPNHANFGLPGHTIGAQAAGVISSSQTARQVQVAARVLF